MKTIRRWMLGGAAAGVLYSLFAFAPASWLASGVASASGGQVLLQAPRGTVWSGSAEVVLSGGTGSLGAFSLPSRLAWRIHPAWFGLHLSLDAPCCTRAASPVQIGLQASSWSVIAPWLSLPAGMLTGLGSPWNTLQLTGELSLSTDNLAGTWSRANGFEQMTGQASLQVSNVTTALSTVKPLGSYRVISAGVDIRLETIGGADNNAAALILAGSGQILQGRVSFTGEAVAARGFEDALSNLLHIVGQWQPSADGRSRSVLKL